RAATYQTTLGERYVWTTATDNVRVTAIETDDNQLFGSSHLTLSSNTDFSVQSDHVVSIMRLDDGTYLTTAGDYTQQGTTSFAKGVLLPTDSGYGDNGNQVLNGSASAENQDLITSNYSYITNQNDPNYLVETGSHRDCNWWTVCIDSDEITDYRLTQDYTTIKTYSLKADNPIAINFICSDTGGITVASRSDVTLDGAVTARNGDVTICAGLAACGAAPNAAASIIDGNDGAVLTGKAIDLETSGSIGGMAPDPAAPGIAPPVAVSLVGAATGGGALIAEAGDGRVVLAAAGDLPVEKITAGGQRENGTAVNLGVSAIDLKAGGNIRAASAGAMLHAGDTPLIQAARVTLVAPNGAVGSIADPLLVETGFVAGDTDRQFGDPATDPTLVTDPNLGLSVTAADDIGIESAAWSGGDGTMLIDQVLSAGGHVLLVSPGQILDNEPTQTVDTRTYDQLLGYWNSLGLLGDDPDDPTSTANADKQQLQIKAFENRKTQAYDQYWQIRLTQPDGGKAYDPTFTVTVAPGTALYNALFSQYRAEVLGADPTLTGAALIDAVTQKITAYAASQTTTYHQLESEVGGISTSFDPAFRYQASGTDITSITTGAVWTTRELSFALSPGALKTVTDTNPVLKAPNVSGLTVTLDAGVGIGETVGAGTADVGVKIPADLDPRNLTDAQKIALATAERSDLELDISNIALPANPTQQQLDDYAAAQQAGILGTGVTVIPLGARTLTAAQQAALDAAADGLVPDHDLIIDVLSKRPLNFATPGALDITVGTATSPTGLDRGTAYLASRGAALLGDISVQGETRIKVMGSIVNAPVSAVNTGNLILESAQGNIGGATPLAIDPLAGATLTARAQDGVNIRVTGTSEIDTVYSPNDVTLESTGSMLNANDDLLINVLGTRVTLTAEAGDIGSLAHPLNVGVNLGGGIFADASGSVYLYGPVNSSFVIDAVTAGLDASLTAAVDGEIAGPVSATGLIDLVAGGTLAIDTGTTVKSTAGDIDVDAGSF
ncbi:MAG TPA: hypothetical protein VFX03_11690, partial [Thermomicrobiales bacterium]|nr:hypothetical protein [Thermomicrobiales bacterium]